MNLKDSMRTAIQGTEPFVRDLTGRPRLPLDNEVLYEFGSLIRGVEQALLDLFGKGQLSGTTHTCLGQECCQMGVVRALTDSGDAVLSNHRNHGHFLTYSGDIRGLIAEIMGREGGTCGGVGGSQHLAYGHFHSNGVQAGMTAIGVGQALARKLRGSSGIVAAIVGDGTTGEGLLYESMNLASIWNVPILFVLENNGIAQTTPTMHTVGGSIEARGAAFGLRTWRMDDASPSFFADTEAIVSEVRRSGAPGLLVIDTYRLGPHSKGDDLRSEDEMARIRDRDPLLRLGSNIPASRRLEIDAANREFLAGVLEWALRQPEATKLPAPMWTAAIANPASRRAAPVGNVRSVLCNALESLLAADAECLILGEDLHDPYGGAFKVTAGLSSKYPERVISTPISEAGVTGAAIGLALAGFRPIVEIMFADFLTLAMDQLYNHAAKFPGMFPEAQVPLMIRTPSGGRRGYGPTHSQCPENLACSIPGMTVLFPSHRHDVGAILESAVRDWPYPKIYFEHKLLYGLACQPGDYRELEPGAADTGAALFPTLVTGAVDPDVTIVTYGYSVAMAEQLMARLAEEEVAVEIIAPCLLSPFPKQTIIHRLLKRQRILVIEEAHTEYGIGAEIGALLASAGYRGKFQRIGTSRMPIPAARSLESQVVPSVDALINAAIDILLPAS
jgi:2-oxoisovalerate dehydrogenase E1 component